jgi:hypothetical protein
MAKRSPVPSPPPLVTPDRAARLCRLLRLIEGTGQPRPALLKKLKLDVRGFYRDLKTLRESGIDVELARGRYALQGDLDDAVSRLPFPDPRLTLGEAIQLAKGRTAVHLKIRRQIEAIVS